MSNHAHWQTAQLLKQLIQHDRNQSGEQPCSSAQGGSLLGRERSSCNIVTLRCAAAWPPSRACARAQTECNCDAAEPQYSEARRLKCECMRARSARAGGATQKLRRAGGGLWRGCVPPKKSTARGRQTFSRQNRAPCRGAAHGYFQRESG